MKRMAATLASLASVFLAGCDMGSGSKSDAPSAWINSPVSALAAVAVTRDGLKLESMDGDVEVRQNADGFVIVDMDAAAHRSVKWIFTGVQPGVAYQATLAVRMDAPVSVGRLLRVAEISAGSERAADCSFMEATGEVASRGDGAVGTPSLRNEAGKITISCAILTSTAPERLIVYLLPAVGSNATSYSESGVGTLRVESLELRRDTAAAAQSTPAVASVNRDTLRVALPVK